MEYDYIGLYDIGLTAAGGFFSRSSCYLCGKTSVDNKGKWSRVRRWPWAVGCGLALESVHFAAWWEGSCSSEPIIARRVEVSGMIVLTEHCKSISW